jgi:hypothetical protein
MISVPPLFATAVIAFTVWSCKWPRLLVVRSPIDRCNLGYPTLAFSVFESKDFLARPMKVICDIRYLLIKPL